MRGQGRGTIRRQRLKHGWTYVADWTTESGRRIRRNLGQDREVAQRILIEEIRKRSRAKAGLSSELGQDTPIEHLASEYAAELSTRATPKHVRLVERQLGMLPGVLHARLVRDLRPEAYEHYRQRQLRAGLARATVNTGLIALSGMLRWAVATRRIAENPLASLRVLRTGRAFQKRPGARSRNRRPRRSCALPTPPTRSRRSGPPPYGRSAAGRGDPSTRPGRGGCESPRGRCSGS